MTTDIEGQSLFEIDTQSYSAKAIEAHIRGELSIRDLSASLGVSRSHAYRLVNRFKIDGQDGLRSKKIGNKNRALDPEFRAHVLTIVSDMYSDFGAKFASEKLHENHGLVVNVATLRNWMIQAGIWTDKKGRAPKIYSPRPPRERVGELIQVDGSYHKWFEKRGPESCLILFIDDATSRIMHMRMVDNESSFNYMSCMNSYIRRFGRPSALYSDKYGVFRSPHQNKYGEREPTQFSRACFSLGIRIICAESPQAKGRVERAFRTLQDRFLKEMRLRNISTMEEANRYIPEFTQKHNSMFAREPSSGENAHLPIGNLNLDHLLTYNVQRKVFKDLSLSFNKIRYILEDSELSRSTIGKLVTVSTGLSGEVNIWFDENSIPYRTFDKIRRFEDFEPVDRKRLGAALDLAAAINAEEPHHFQRNGHVLAGFRSLFSQPGDDRSVQLRSAPPEIRRQHGGRPRAKLGNHPIIILKDRLS